VRAVTKDLRGQPLVLRTPNTDTPRSRASCSSRSSPSRASVYVAEDAERREARVSPADGAPIEIREANGERQLVFTDNRSIRWRPSSC
jgi:hypothetical protein